MTQDTGGHIEGHDPGEVQGDRDQLREVQEAQAACEAALSSLHEAQRKVDSARSWGTYDTCSAAACSRA